MTSAIRLVIADDEQIVRDGVRMILEAAGGFAVVGEANDGREAVRLARETRPDVLLMDVRMPGTDGIEATRMLCGEPEPPAVVLLTTFDLDEYVFEGLRAGASGFLLKSLPTEQLVDGLRTAAAGEVLLAPAITRRLVERFVQSPPPGGAPEALEGLTARELDVLRGLGRGRSNAEIARSLYISETTVRTHITRVFAKLGLRDRAQAVVFAYESGLVRVGDDG